MEPVKDTSPKTTSNNLTKKKKLALILLGLLLISVVTLGVFVLGKKSTPTPEPSSSSSVVENSDTEEDRATKTLSVNYPKSAAFDGNDELGGMFTIEAPASWQAYKGTEEKREGYDGDFRAVTYYIGEPSGKFHLELEFGIDGLGGGCDTNQQVYSLTNKLNTKIDGYFWTEYDAEKGLKLEHYLDSNTDANYLKHKSLKVGQSNTDTCNLYSYPTLPTQDGQPAAFLQIVAGSAKDKGQVYPNSDGNDRVSYEELESETGFIKAIQTVNYTK